MVLAKLASATTTLPLKRKNHPSGGYVHAAVMPPLQFCPDDRVRAYKQRAAFKTCERVRGQLLCYSLLLKLVQKNPHVPLSLTRAETKEMAGLPLSPTASLL
jgi:hypothetical protein